MNLGIFYAASAYILWGLFPIYFKALHPVSATEIVLHRMVWSLVFVGGVLAWKHHWTWLAAAFTRPRVVAIFALSAVVLSLNWGIYIWSVNADRIVDASLGYFINPLVNVLLAFVILRERLRPLQWLAIGLVGVGVAWLTWQAHQFPWIALLLALSFGTYGFIRKTAPLGALEGLAMETIVLFPFALAYLIWLAIVGENMFVTGSMSLRALLMALGPVTAIPLLMFAAGARRIPFSLLGLLQYICPSLQLVIGVWLYGEPFPPARAVGYAAIWLALFVYSAEGAWQARRRSEMIAAVAPS